MDLNIREGRAPRARADGGKLSSHAGTLGPLYGSVDEELPAARYVAERANVLTQRLSGSGAGIDEA